MKIKRRCYNRSQLRQPLWETVFSQITLYFSHSNILIDKNAKIHTTFPNICKVFDMLVGSILSKKKKENQQLQQWNKKTIIENDLHE